MQKLHRIWRCIEDRADTASPLARWRLAAGAEFEILHPFLASNGGTVAPVYPCPQCGRDMLLVPVGDGIGAEPDEDADCASIENVPSAEAVEYVVNWGALLRAVGVVCDCSLECGPRRCGCIAARGEVARDFRRVAVYACFGESDLTVCEEAIRWLAECRTPSLFVTAVHRPACANLLAKTECRYVALEDIVGIGDSGTLVRVCDLMDGVKTAGTVNEDGGAIAAIVTAQDAIISEFQELKDVVNQALDQSDRRRLESEQRRMTIEEMSAGPDRFLSGLASRMKDEKTRVLLLALMEKVNECGRERYLTYAEIGERLGGITKQAVGARVSRLRHDHPGPWDYIDGQRQPDKPSCYSELSPSARRKDGIDESYNYDAQ